MAKEELLEFPGVVSELLPTRDHRPHRRQDAQEPHPRAGRRQGPGRDDALWPDQGSHHLSLQV